MPIQGALYCRQKSPVRFEIDSPAALREAVGTGRLPSAVVVRVAELKLFGGCAALFKDRRKKDEHKGLSEYLLCQGGGCKCLGQHQVRSLVFEIFIDTNNTRHSIG